jgi:hypothetical protein
MPFKDPEIAKQYRKDKWANLTPEQREEHRKYRKKWRESKKKHLQQIANEYNKNRKQKLLNEFGSCCNACGSTENLQFDHLDKHDKEGNVSTILYTKGFDEAVKEAKKCQLLCNKCHILKTTIHHDNQSLLYGTRIANVEYRGDEIIVTLKSTN